NSALDQIVFPDWAIEDCETPDGDTGTCTSIYSCKPILDFLEKVPQPISLKVRSLLRSYTCGYEGRTVNVCCPPKPIKIPKSEALTLLPPPDVKKHKNVDLLPENCGILDTTERIVYGNKTGLFEFPWMALLSYQTKRGPDFLCGGTIINNRYILTAAHCISNKLLGVRVGEHDINSPIDCEELDGERICAPPYKDMSVEKVIRHPQYDKRVHTNDVALLRVPPMNFSFENIQPICLPLGKARNYNFTNRNVVVTGWGTTEDKSSSSVLLKAELPVVPLEECQNIYVNIVPVTYRQLCAGGSTKSDSCTGDSGGPLHVAMMLHGDVRFVQQGIVSFGPSRCGRYKWAIEDEGCRTPDRGVGTCITIYKCKPMMDLLEQVSQPIPSKVSNLLKSYHCGFDGNQPKVCCPNKPINVPGLNVVQVSAPPPPDVSRHRNIKLLPYNCGLMDTTNRIVYGNKTSLFEYPWMTLLSYRTQRGPDFKCGGTIINEKYILTAAHCITNLKFSLLGVRIGEHDISTSVDCEITREGEKICSPPHQDLAIEEIIPHPDYNSKAYTNDIGLLRVATPMTITLENIKPICLPVDQARNYNFTNQNVVVTGWGATETGRSSPILLKAGLPIVPLKECQKKYDNVAKLNHRQLCAGGTTKSDSCAGDSGGPLHVLMRLHEDQRFIQQGIVSFGPRDCGHSGFPGVYTRVDYYMDWILNNMKPNINLLPKNCGVLDTSEKIVFANKTNLLEFPWMVLLSYKTCKETATPRGPDFKCGGTIINDKYILTAAHCITELRFPLLGVRIGEHDIRTRIDCEDTYCAPPYQDLAIEKIIPHPQFSTKSLTYDIGLLKVAPMNLSLDNIKPVCLPVDKARFYDFTNKTKVVVAGWGITETGQTSPELLKAELPIASSEQCRNIYGDMKITINYRQLCAGGSTESDSCGGDSGGPLHVVDVLYDDQRLVQRGIVSFGPRKCGRNNERLSGGDPCRTPNHESGTCLSIRSCKPMLDLLATIPQPLSPKARTFLKSYQCGSERKTPKVCCPSNPILLDQNDPAKQPPDVSRHRNINLLPKDCGHLDTLDKIVNGNKTGLFEFPWMALLSYKTRFGPRFKCGGTIINNRYILTAAHCLTNLKFSLLGVRVGEHNINTKVDCESYEYGENICAPPYQDLSIEEIIPHPQYVHKAFPNDIGLLRVTPIDLSLENSRPVCLPLAENRNYNFTSRNVIVTGWGITETGYPSPELLKALLPVIPFEECKENYKNIVALNDRQMCAGGKKSKSDSCGGDSGGPLHAFGSLHGEPRLVQQGIVSFGPRDCGREPVPGVYTRVAFYMDWILDNIKP
ncbi:uncharacterized protein BDFB_002243, partial [Asbolus verrucosus]